MPALSRVDLVGKGLPPAPAWRNSIDRSSRRHKFLGIMQGSRARVRFQETGGRLEAVEVVRSGSRPIISALHRALFTVGVVITSYRVQTTAGGLRERMELASQDGRALTDQQSEQVRTATLPIAWDGD